MKEAEAAAADEAKKTEQRRRELQMEREMEELRRLQGKASSADGYVLIRELYSHRNLT